MHCNFPVPQAVLNLLSKGLKFVPDIRPTGVHEVYNAGMKIARGVDSFMHFYNRGMDSAPTKRLKRTLPAKKWMPDVSFAGDLVRLQTRAFCENWPQRVPKDPWTMLDRFAYGWMKRHCGRHIVVCDTDKNMGPAIFDVDWIFGEIHKHLEANCAEVTGAWVKDRLVSVKSDAQGCLLWLVNVAGMITWAEYRYLTQFWKAKDAGSVRVLPKLHKSPISSRPIFAAGTCWLRPVAEWVSDVVSDLLRDERTIVRSSDDFQAKLKSVCFSQDTDYELLCMDVENLYPSINTEHLYAKISQRVHRRYRTGVAIRICCLIKHVMDNNFVEFQGWLYHIVLGLATGNSAAVALANGYLLGLDSLLDDDVDCLMLARYIDDLFMIIRKGAAERLRCLGCSFHPSIKLSVVGCGDSVNFLDMTVFKSADGLQTKLFSKPGNLYSFVPFCSGHPNFVFRSVFFDQSAKVGKRRNAELRTPPFGGRKFFL
eukprot:6492502-Amphidinium_carterae.1